MSGVWFTSDLHIGHKKVAQLRATEAMVALENVFDPACAVEWHDRWLASCWDYVVGKDDQVWVLGDLSLRGARSEARALEWISKRPGHKHLIAGNHDGIHPMHRDSHKRFPAYMAVFDSVQMAARRRVTVSGEKGGHVDVLLSHFPYAGDHLGVDRYPEWRLKDAGNYLLHGHTHSSDVGSWHPKQIHVGVDAWKHGPVSLDQITEMIRAAEEAPPRAWEDVPMFDTNGEVTA